MPARTSSPSAAAVWATRRVPPRRWQPFRRAETLGHAQLCRRRRRPARRRLRFGSAAAAESDPHEPAGLPAGAPSRRSAHDAAAGAAPLARPRRASAGRSSTGRTKVFGHDQHRASTSTGSTLGARGPRRYRIVGRRPDSRPFAVTQTPLRPPSRRFVRRFLPEPRRHSDRGALSRRRSQWAARRATLPSRRPPAPPARTRRAMPGPPALHVREVNGGWYDAGDQGKYVVNGGIALWTLLDAYERRRRSTAPRSSQTARRVPGGRERRRRPFGRGPLGAAILPEIRCPTALASRCRSGRSGTPGPRLHRDRRRRHGASQGRRRALDEAADAAPSRPRAPPALPAEHRRHAQPRRDGGAMRTHLADDRPGLFRPLPRRRRARLGRGQAQSRSLCDRCLHRQRRLWRPRSQRRSYWAAAELFVTTGKPEYAAALQASPGSGPPSRPNRPGPKTPRSARSASP